MVVLETSLGTIELELDAEKAFAYGYLSHLAADTVAHEILTDDMKNMEHAWAELKADSMIKKTFSTPQRPPLGLLSSPKMIINF